MDLESRIGQKVNLVVSPGARAVQIPSFRLRNTRLLTLVNLLGNLVANLEVQISVRGSFVDPEDIEDVMSEAEEDDGEELIRSLKTHGTPVVLVNMATRDEDDQPIEQGFRLYSMARLIEQYSIEDLATAVETTWQMMPKNFAASLKYHDETRLLICSGTERHLEIVDEVVDLMTRNSEANLRTRRLEDEEKELRSLYQQLLKEQQSLRATLESIINERRKDGK